MQILEVNRQIYKEASVTFYSQNVFYFDLAVVTLPFLRDRGTRSLENLRKISILYPSPAPFGFTSRLGPSYMEGDERMWEDLCCFLSLRVRKLAHLDLRVQRLDGCIEWWDYLSISDSEWRSMQTPSDFPFKRRNELATLSTETEVTVSAGTTDGFVEGRQIAYERPLFTPLRTWLDDSIARLRDRSGLSVTSPESERLEAAKAFWALRRKCRRQRIWHLTDDGIESEEDDEDPDADVEVAETAFRRECSP